MELVLILVLFFGGIIILSFLITGLLKLLRKRVIRKAIENLSPDVKSEIRRNPTYMPFEKEDREAYLQVNMKEGITTFLIASLVLLVYGVIKQASLVIVLIVAAVFAVAIALVLLSDRIAVGGKDLYVVRAFCYSRVKMQRTDSASVIYYDFKSMMFEGAVLQGISAGVELRAGQYCYVIVRAKKNRLKAVNISPKPYLRGNTNEIKELYEKIYKYCEENEEEYGSAYFEEGASEKEIEQWETKTGIHIPDTYREWLKLTKNCDIPDIYGMLGFPGTDLPPGLPDDYVIIGTIVGDGELICFSKSDGHFITFFEGRVADSFPDFSEVLKQRFISGMDAYGV